MDVLECLDPHCTRCSRFRVTRIDTLRVWRYHSSLTTVKYNRNTTVGSILRCKSNTIVSRYTYYLIETTHRLIPMHSYATPPFSNRGSTAILQRLAFPARPLPRVIQHYVTRKRTNYFQTIRQTVNRILQVASPLGPPVYPSPRNVGFHRCCVGVLTA